MNTQVTIDVNGDARQILQCAYETLLSMGKTVDEYGTNMPNYINYNLLFARASTEIRYTSKLQFISLVIVRQIDNAKCELTLTIDGAGYISSPEKGDYVFLMSEFLRILEQNLQKMTGQHM